MCITPHEYKSVRTIGILTEKWDENGQIFIPYYPHKKKRFSMVMNFSKIRMKEKKNRNKNNNLGGRGTRLVNKTNLSNSDSKFYYILDCK